MHPFAVALRDIHDAPRIGAEPSPGASHELTPAALDPDLIRSASITFLEGYLWGPERPRAAMLEASRDHLLPGGRLYLPTASIQDGSAVLRTARRVFGEGRVRELRERLMPLPGKLSESAVVRRFMDSGVVEFFRRGSRLLWRLRVWELTAPPS